MTSHATVLSCRSPIGWRWRIPAGLSGRNPKFNIHLVNARPGHKSTPAGDVETAHHGGRTVRRRLGQPPVGGRRRYNCTYTVEGSYTNSGLQTTQYHPLRHPALTASCYRRLSEPDASYLTQWDVPSSVHPAPALPGPARPPAAGTGWKKITRTSFPRLLERIICTAIAWSFKLLMYSPLFVMK